MVVACPLPYRVPRRPELSALARAFERGRGNDAQHPDLLGSLRAASGGGDVRLTVCRRGMDAVRALTALSFDRLILDLETPELDGPFLVSIARRIDPHLPIVAVSRGPVVQAREIQHKGVAHQCSRASEAAPSGRGR
jgi:CheY-like chemotaxis protein